MFSIGNCLANPKGLHEKPKTLSHAAVSYTEHVPPSSRSSQTVVGFSVGSGHQVVQGCSLCCWSGQSDIPFTILGRFSRVFQPSQTGRFDIDLAPAWEERKTAHDIVSPRHPFARERAQCANRLCSSAAKLCIISNCAVDLEHSPTNLHELGTTDKQH
eukprot:5206970-Amphidinium_carterae.1